MAGDVAAAIAWLRVAAPAVGERRGQQAEQGPVEVTVRYVDDWRQLGQGDEGDDKDDEGDS